MSGANDSDLSVGMADLTETVDDNKQKELDGSKYVAVFS